MKRTILVQAPAKINIGLWVKEKRPDGFHELATYMHTLSLADTIAIRETREEGIRIECSNPGVPVDGTNLAHRAAMLILEHLRLPPNHLIQIDKKIPMAAGLGGGSSDAAAVMRGLVRMYDRTVAGAEGLELAAHLGSDVPFLLKGGLAAAEGRGEKLTFFDSQKSQWYVVLAVPNGLEVSTKWAYENYHPGDNLRKAEAFSRILPAYRSGQPQQLLDALFNDLESVTLQRHPTVQRLKELLLADGPAPQLMSGSGPACYALFQDRNRALTTARRLKEAGFTTFLESTTRGIL